MKKISSKISIILIICFLCIIKSSVALAVDNNVKHLKEKTSADMYKIWTVKFNGKVDISSINNGVYVKDLNTNSLAEVKFQRGYVDSTFEILPPQSGYIKGHKYEITINKNVKSKENVNLKRDVLMDFYIKDNRSCNADVSVIVAEQPFAMFKKITVNKTDLSDAKRFKVEGSDSICNIGEECTLFTSENKLKVYFYGNGGNKILGETSVDVDKNNNGKVEVQVLK